MPSTSPSDREDISVSTNTTMMASDKESVCEERCVEELVAQRVELTMERMMKQWAEHEERAASSRDKETIHGPTTGAAREKTQRPSEITSTAAAGATEGPTRC